LTIRENNWDQDKENGRSPQTGERPLNKSEPLQKFRPGIRSSSTAQQVARKMEISLRVEAAHLAILNTRQKTTTKRWKPVGQDTVKATCKIRGSSRRRTHHQQRKEKERPWTAFESPRRGTYAARVSTGTNRDWKKWVLFILRRNMKKTAAGGGFSPNNTHTHQTGRVG